MHLPLDGLSVFLLLEIKRIDIDMDATMQGIASTNDGDDRARNARFDAPFVPFLPVDTRPKQKAVSRGLMKKVAVSTMPFDANVAKHRFLLLFVMESGTYSD
jgi:hypothetical protein